MDKLAKTDLSFVLHASVTIWFMIPKKSFKKTSFLFAPVILLNVWHVATVTCWTYQLMAVCVTCTIVPISVECISLWLCVLPVPLYQYLLNVSAYGCVCYLYDCTNIFWMYQLMAVHVTCTIVPISVECISLWLRVLHVPLYQFCGQIQCLPTSCIVWQAISQATSAQLQRCLRTNLISPITQIFIFCFSNLPPLSGWP